MNDSTCKIGVIGLGSMGTGYMKHLAESDRWNVVAACDLSPTGACRAPIGTTGRPGRMIDVWKELTDRIEEGL